MPYKVQLIEKRIERDSYADGCIGDEQITMTRGDAPGWSADTLHRAVAVAFGELGLPVDYFFRSDEDTAEYLGCNRMENDDGEPPTAEQTAAFERGEITLWLADYTFRARWVESRAVTLDELKAAFPAARIE